MFLMNVQTVLIRLGAAILVGALIGVQREAAHRPAGLRTHMLVAIGSTLVMLTGEYLISVYAGTVNSDPARLGAQVISGIGFLGAGTIMKEGVTVRGLTTAASLWTTACIGLAVGSGFIFGGLAAALATMITLTLIERIHRLVSGRNHLGTQIILFCDNTSDVLEAIERIAERYQATITHTYIQKTQTGANRLHLHLEAGSKSWNAAQLSGDLSRIPGVLSFQTDAL